MFDNRYRCSINGTATLPTAKSCALNGKTIYVQTFVSRVEHGLGFATVPEWNSGHVTGLTELQTQVHNSFDNWLRTLNMQVDKISCV